MSPTKIFSIAIVLFLLMRCDVLTDAAFMTLTQLSEKQHLPMKPHPKKTQDISISRNSCALSLFRRAAIPDVPPSAAGPPMMKNNRLVLAGNIVRILKKLSIDRTQARAMVRSVAKAAHISELSAIVFAGWLLMPIAKNVYKWRKGKAYDETKFLSSRTHGLASSLGQLGKIGAVVYFVDILAVALFALGIHFPYQTGLSSYVARITFAAWGALRLSNVKQNLLCRICKVRSPESLGKAHIYDKVGDAFIFITTTLLILDWLSVEMGKAIGSVFALGSIGTLVFSLASKDLATQLVSGLHVSEKFYVGEQILLGDGTEGVVVKIGWMATLIRGNDEIFIKIPNADLANQRVSNISRVNQSQVKQSLYFKYQDIDKIPQLIQDIKQEIKTSCPHLITDGSRPFNVHWREFDTDNLKVVVDARFRVPPSCAAHWDTRQEVLKAIARAVKSNGVSFAIPIVELQSEISQEQLSAALPWQPPPWTPPQQGTGSTNNNNTINNAPVNETQ